MLVSVEGFNFYTLQRQLNTTKHIFFSNFFTAKQWRSKGTKFTQIWYIASSALASVSFNNFFQIRGLAIKITQELHLLFTNICGDLQL